MTTSVTPKPITYRLPASTSGDQQPRRSAQLAAAEELGEDYTPLVLAASNAALTLFATQALSTLLISNYYSAEIHVRFWRNFFPYLAIAVPNQAGLIPIVTYSTVISVGVICVGVIRSLLKHRAKPLTMQGWSTGLAMAATLLGFQYLRHRYSGPLVDLWVLAQAASGLVATTIVYVGCRPLKNLTTNQSTANQSTTKTENRTGQQHHDGSNITASNADDRGNAGLRDASNRLASRSELHGGRH